MGLARCLGFRARTVAVFPNGPPAPNPFPFPPPFIAPQAVPTDVAVGPDGAFYVSQLTGFPFPTGGSTIWRVTSDGQVSAYATGLTMVTSLAWKGDMNVELRPVAIKRCLTNLVSNAQRYASEIRIEAVRGRTTVEITVDDNGPGIPPEKYEDVFRPFFRLDESRNVDTGGSGLGLTIARDIARSHGGDVALAKSPLGGLRVVVRLPV